MEPNRPDELRRRLRGERGQTTLFVLSCFLTFFFLFALVANVGQAVNRRVMLQMVADAGAFSGASAQATAMNTISYFNNIIYSSWKLTEVLMLYFTFHLCGADDAITTAYKTVESVMSIMIQVTNRAGVFWALLEAEAVTQQNIDELFPDGSVKTPLQSFGAILGGGGGGSLPGSATHIGNMQKAWPALLQGALVRLEQDEVRKNWLCYSPPFTIRSKSDTFKLWYKKSDQHEVTRFYWWVYAEPVDALVLAKKPWMPFGFPQVPEMTAVALAKPVGGNIENRDWFDFSGEAKYVAKMMPLSTIKPYYFGLLYGRPWVAHGFTLRPSGPAEVLH